MTDAVIKQHGNVSCPRCGALAWETNVHGIPVVSCPCVGDRIVVMAVPPHSTATCLACRSVFDATYDQGRCQNCDDESISYRSGQAWWRRG